MKKKLLIILSACLLVACEKDIPIDYHDIDGLYVAEATLTQEKATVRLTTTQSVTDNNRDGHYVEDATVRLSCKKQDWSETLRYTRNGIYTCERQGEPGMTYDLDIQIGDRHYTSSSTMQQAPQVGQFRFVWQKFVSERMLFADLRIQDTPDANSYYFMHIYRNGIGYRWAVTSDEHNHGGELQQLFQCTTQRDMDSGDEDALQEGDRIKVEVRAIDRLSYDYLYSMQVMDNAGTNPVANFTSGLLGYFSAYWVETFNLVFHRADIEEE